MIEIRYAQIRNLDLSNGEGIGVALFVQGCHFHCPNCFNPETWDFSGGKEWTEEVKNKFLELVERPYIKRVSLLGGECLAEENLDGVLDLVTEINKRYNIPQDIDDNSRINHDILNANANKIRLSSPQKSIWIYSGYTWEDILDEDYNFLEMHDALRQAIIAQCNVFVDGQYKESQRDITIPYRGSKNQRVIDIQKSLQKGGVALWCN